MTMKLYTAKQLPKAIRSFHDAAQVVQTEAHLIACSALHHLGKTKDIRHTMAFLQAFPEMGRMNGLKAWLEEFGPIKFANPAELKEGAPEAVFVKDKATRIGEAMEKPFWKFKAVEGKAYQPLDVDKELQRIVKRLKTDAEKTGRDHNAIIMALSTAGATTAH